MPMPMPSMTVEEPHPPIQRTPSSTSVVLVNGRPLKPCLKPTSLPSIADGMAASGARHVHVQSMPSTAYGPRNVHFKEYDDGLVSVRLFRSTGKPASVSKPSSDTESDSESESEPESEPDPPSPPLPRIFSIPRPQAPRPMSPPFPSVTVEEPHPPTQRTRSFTSVVLVNGRPLKPSLKSTSLPSIADDMAASGARHIHVQSMPSTPYAPKSVHFNESDLVSVRFFRSSGKPASVSEPSSDTETDSETDSEFEPEPSTYPIPHIFRPQAPGPMTLPFPSVINEEQPIFPYPLSSLKPQMYESTAQTPSLRTRSRAAGSNVFLFVPPTLLFFLYPDTPQSFPPPRSTPGLFRAR